MRRVVQPAPRHPGQLQPGHPPRQGRQQHLALQPGQRRADAGVDAEAERDVAVGAAAQVEAVRIIPAARVTVRGREEQQHHLARADTHPPHRDLAGGGAEERLHRRRVPQRLLERGPGPRGVLPEQPPLGRVPGQAVQGAAEPDHGGVHARREQRPDQQRGLIFGDRAVVHAGVDPRPQAARDERAPGAPGRDPGSHLGGLAQRRPGQLVTRAERVERHVAVGEQLLPAGLGQPDRVGEHLQREGLGDVRHAVHGPAPGQFAGQFAGRAGEAVAQVAYGPRGEGPGDGRMGPGVLGRVGLKQQAGRAPGGFAAEIAQPHPGGRAERLPVAQRLVHLGVAGHGPDAVLLQPDHRARVTQSTVPAERVSQEVIAERVDGADRDPLRCRLLHRRHTLF